MNKKEFDDQIADAVRAYNSTLPKVTDRVSSTANYNERQGFRAGYREGFRDGEAVTPANSWPGGGYTPTPPADRERPHGRLVRGPGLAHPKIPLVVTDEIARRDTNEPQADK